MFAVCREVQFVVCVPVTDEDNQGKAVPELVGTGGGLGRVGSGHFVQEPVRGRAEALLVLSAARKILVSGGLPFREIFDHFSQRLAELVIWQIDETSVQKSDVEGNSMTLTGRAF